MAKPAPSPWMVLPMTKIGIVGASPQRRSPRANDAIPRVRNRLAPLASTRGPAITQVRTWAARGAPAATGIHSAEPIASTTEGMTVVVASDSKANMVIIATDPTISVFSADR